MPFPACRWRLSRLLLGAALAVAGLAGPARAQIGSDRYASIVVDAATGNILEAANMDATRFPASLTKMMTMYMLFEALRDRRVSLNQYVPVSAEAASMPPTKLGLVPGSLITVEQAILGLVTKSANDAAAALGEMLGGDEDRFAQMMTLRARALGMTGTQFRNASGLPDDWQVTTARDMAVLARHLIQDFPNYYHYFSTPYFTFNGRYIPSHQTLLQTYPGADGLKTGYIKDSGYNVVTSAVRGDTRLIGVVFGGASGWERDAHMKVLLDQGFERMGVPVLVARQEPGRFPSFVASARAAPAPYVVARGPQQFALAAPPMVAARAYPHAAHTARAVEHPRRAIEPRAEREAPMPYVAGRTMPARMRDASQVQVIRPQGARPVAQLLLRHYGG